MQKREKRHFLTFPHKLEYTHQALFGNNPWVGASLLLPDVKSVSVLRLFRAQITPLIRRERTQRSDSARNNLWDIPYVTGIYALWEENNWPTVKRERGKQRGAINIDQQ